jgi:F420-dependent methylenetetrahydromethanopterin dehydrogenase
VAPRDHSTPSGEVHTAASKSPPDVSNPTATKPEAEVATDLILWSSLPPNTLSSCATRDQAIADAFRPAVVVSVAPGWSVVVELTTWSVVVSESSPS